MEVYKAICAVMSDLSSEGISKDRSNSQQGYKFRGIDDVLNALSPILTKHNLVILPRVLSRVCEERETSKGGRMAYVTVDAEFDLVCAEDGSKHTIRTQGEAMDSADKATNKAMSAAYKYATIQAFCIPTEGDNDADAHTPEVRAAPKAPPKEAPKYPGAGEYLRDVVKLNAQDVSDFKSACGETPWGSLALGAKAAGVTTKEGLYQFLAQAPLEVAS